MIRSGIYAIVHSRSQRCYIGSASSLRQRWSQHKYHLRKGSHENQKLQNAWSKYGEGEFSFEVLVFVPNRDELIQQEQIVLDRERPVFNIALIAGTCLGVRHSPEVNAKKRSWLGRKHTPESIEKMRRVQKGKVLSLEHKEKLRAARIGKSPSKETRGKMRKAMIGQRRTPEQRQRISLAQKALGKRLTPEAISALSAARTQAAIKRREAKANGSI